MDFSELEEDEEEGDDDEEEYYDHVHGMTASARGYKKK
jgi:hypothetical protein